MIWDSTYKWENGHTLYIYHYTVRTYKMPKKTRRSTALHREVKLHNTDEQNKAEDIFAGWSGSFSGRTVYRGADTCVCGQPRIVYLNTIFNSETNTTLGPIGSSCIQKFLPSNIWEKVQAEKNTWETTCESCSGRKFKCESICRKCFGKQGEYIRQKWTTIESMDSGLLRWMICKHPRYQDGSNRKMLERHLAHHETKK